MKLVGYVLVILSCSLVVLANIGPRLAGASFEPAQLTPLALSSRDEINRRACVLIIVERAGEITGFGSGSIVDARGYVLTNFHVVEDADTFYIGVNGARQDAPPEFWYRAEVIATDKPLDLALLQITMDEWGHRLTEPLNLPSVEIGDSDTVQLQDSVVIWGYSWLWRKVRSLEELKRVMTVTVTRGMISGFEPQGDIARAWMRSDALIGPGNSGGTAVDQNGQMIGIPSATVGPGEGLGIAMIRPINLAKHVLANIPTPITPTPTPSETPAPSPTITPTSTPSPTFTPALSREEILRLACVRVLAHDGEGFRAGAGGVIDARGYVLTSYRLIQDTTVIYIGVNSVQRDAPPEKWYQAEVVAMDSGLGLALLRLTAELGNPAASSPLLAAVELGDSDNIKLLDPVIVCGYAHEPYQRIEQLMRVSMTMEEGIVTAFEGAADYVRAWIWSDAAAGPGSLGGIVVDHDGTMIGLVGDIVEPGNAPGLTKVRPINIARRLIALVPARPTETPTPSATPTETLAPTWTPTPAATPTPTSTMTPTPTVGVPLVTALVDLNVRSGPGVEYPRIGALMKGQSARVTGRSPDLMWWQIVYPPDPSGRGWVSGRPQYTSAANVDNVPIVSPPPLPTATPTPTPVPTPDLRPRVSVVVRNDTGGPITLNLSGPMNYSFKLGPGDHTITVVVAEYRYEAFGCGGSVKRGTIFLGLAGDVWRFWCERF